MSYPQLMLGGVPLVLLAGSVEQAVDSVAGEGVVRLSLGDAVKLTHWSKASGTLSSNDGLLPFGLDGLDYSAPLELRLTLPESIISEAHSVTLTSTPRPDKAPWAFVLLDGQWRPTPCSFAAGVVEVTPVTGAERYSVNWMPVYTVLASRPPKSLGSRYGWTINWEQA